MIARGAVVVMGRNDEQDLVFAFDAEKGTKLWMKEVTAKSVKKWDGIGNGARATLVIEGDCVYTLGVYGHLACWDLKTGAQKWLINALDDSKTQVPYWGVCGSPVIYGKDILVKVGGYAQGPNAPLVLAYDKATGKLDWKSPNAPGSWAPLAVLKLDGKDVLMAWASDGLRGLDPGTGKFLWQIPWKTAYDCHANLPAVEGSSLFLTTGYGTGCQAFEIKEDKPVSLCP
ncbi:MAG: PQQ-binding-like beta-propeller repeat protein [Planctomycetes bacterium]|nr:PQQ-binding-like beta-propeller repeat protein [Planctomycetota bacterium]